MAAPRSRTPLIIGIVAGITCLAALLVIVLVVVIGGVTFWNSSSPDTSPDTAPGTHPEETSGGGELVLPPGVAADQPYLEVSTSEDGPVVEVYIDFLCPHCATFHDAQGEDLARLAQDGEITLRMHPRPMLDASSTPAGYSGRAANAAVCAYAEDPAQWSAAETALFTDQPDAAGLSDAELDTRISEATGLEVGECLTEGTYLPWIQDVVEPAAQSTTQGTPAVFIDGEQFTGDLIAPGSLEEAIAAA
ncbi:MAG: DsbA family protein [Brachybacterium sp.]|nr:DsbA family protein [Brachybacterium sp.]